MRCQRLQSLLPVSVCLSVCLYVTRLHVASLYKTAKHIKVLLAVRTFRGTKNIILDKVPIPQRGKETRFDAAFGKLLCFLITSSRHAEVLLTNI